MTRQPLRESDLRSLERARMYEIFSPLDTDEPLPRELVLAAKRFRSVGRWELAGAAWLPSLLLILVVGGWSASAPDWWRPPPSSRSWASWPSRSSAGGARSSRVPQPVIIDG
jgi:hypothetical protein